ncbi:hypothetical protein F2Q68_00016030 [Brassica cretica]|uniref:Uncharacterized protein n=1 Tax=Brassica cretica TaxID=69181 RepID=A0A8S9HBL9_BRACR|nr:hypothetical protein F2Q68_00016030 [Brassica cretica]
MLFVDEKAKLFQDSVNVHRLIKEFIGSSLFCQLWFHLLPFQLSSNDSVAYNACSPHHNYLNKPVKICAKAVDFQNQVQPLEEALNGMSMPVVEYEEYSLQEDTSLVTVIGETFDQLVLNCPENVLLEVSNENESWFCGGEAAGSSSTTSKYGGVKELKSVTLQELNSCVLNSTPHVRPLNKVYF